MRSLLTGLLTIVLASACTSQQLYDMGQGARRNECTKLADNDARLRCMDAANRDYQHYQFDQQEKTGN